MTLAASHYLVLSQRFELPVTFFLILKALLKKMAAVKTGSGNRLLGCGLALE